MPDLFSRLKHETASSHEALERALDLTRPTLTREEYIELLRAFRGFVGPWETALRLALPVHLQSFAREREKTALLDADLQFMTSADTAASTSAPVCTALPMLDSTARALGSMYVMEGSTLGGRFIAPAMAKRFGLSGREGVTYFDPYEGHTGSMWNGFKQRVSEELNESDADAVVLSARQTFDALRAWLPAASRSAGLLSPSLP
jgi:heme oxygenase